MARILAISSQVARGHVGLSAIVPALQTLGHDVIALPTILLSNHPGHARVAGERIAPELLARMLDTLDANGWLGAVDAVLTGYLPSVEHVAFAREAVQRVLSLNAQAVYLCDPVIGDHPKGVYIAHAAADAIRDTLLPEADMVRLNAFELGWLAGRSIGSEREAADAARALGRDLVLVSSVPDRPGLLSNVLALRIGNESAAVCRVAAADRVPHGTGDLLSALLLGEGLARDDFGPLLLGKIIAMLEVVVAASCGEDELPLVASLRRMIEVRPLPTEPLV